MLIYYLGKLSHINLEYILEIHRGFPNDVQTYEI